MVERGLGWGKSGPPLAARPAVKEPLQSHHFQNFISLIPRHLPYITHWNSDDSSYLGIGAFAPTKGTIIMTTDARIKADRKNAKKSTGPQTEEGKTRSAKNALKHGLLARDTVLPGEDPADFDRQLSALEADIQPANSLEFELVRQIADSQWRMRRLTRLETGFLAAAIADKRRLTERFHPERLQPGYDGETLLLGSGMINRTQALVHLARYDGHLSRRFFRAVKQLADLRDAQHRRDTSGKYENSHTSAAPDPYRGRYVPTQAPPPIDPPSPTAGRIGFRASREPAQLPGRARQQAVSSQIPFSFLNAKQTQSRRSPVKINRPLPIDD